MKQVQIGDEEIRRMVTTFYTTVRQDYLLGHIFEHRFQGQWAPHLDRMCDFWSEVLNASGRYHDNPRQAHAGLMVGAEHFDRWLTLFAKTLGELFDAETAALIYERANRMRSVLESVVLGGPATGLIFSPAASPTDLLSRGQQPKND